LNQGLKSWKTNSNENLTDTTVTDQNELELGSIRSSSSLKSDIQIK
jgi:hypothetical protein